MFGTDIKCLKFFQFWPSASEKASDSELVPKYLGSWGRLERLGCSACDLRQGVELLCSSGRPVCRAGKRHQVGCGELVPVGWVSTLTASRQMAQFRISSGKYFNISITVFFCFINIFLRSFFIFWIKGNHPWRNNGWILSWKSQFPLNAPCSSSRHFPTKGSEISAVLVCAPDEFYLEWFMFFPVSACSVFSVGLIQHPLNKNRRHPVAPSRLSCMHITEEIQVLISSLPLLIMITAMIFTLPDFCLSWMAN